MLLLAIFCCYGSTAFSWDGFEDITIIAGNKDNEEAGASNTFLELSAIESVLLEESATPAVNLPVLPESGPQYSAPAPDLASVLTPASVTTQPPVPAVPLWTPEPVTFYAEPPIFEQELEAVPASTPAPNVLQTPRPTPKATAQPAALSTPKPTAEPTPAPTAPTATAAPATTPEPTPTATAVPTPAPTTPTAAESPDPEARAGTRAPLWALLLTIPCAAALVIWRRRK